LSNFFDAVFNFLATDWGLTIEWVIEIFQDSTFRLGDDPIGGETFLNGHMHVRLVGQIVDGINDGFLVQWRDVWHERRIVEIVQEESSEAPGGSRQPDRMGVERKVSSCVGNMFISILSLSRRERFTLRKDDLNGVLNRWSEI
jgi:hypothetical protein